MRETDINGIRYIHSYTAVLRHGKRIRKKKKREYARNYPQIKSPVSQNKSGFASM